MAEIDWTAINAKLPTGDSAEAEDERQKKFKQFDLIPNRLLSLSEVDKGVRDVLEIDALYNAKPAIKKAFHIAKNSQPSPKGKRGDDYIERTEFKFFLSSLRQYFEYWVAFSRVDANADKRISLIEFTDNKEKIEQWVGKIDPEAEFKNIDTNKGGFILFDEFCNWAITKNLDLEDDDDDIDQ